MKFQNFAGTQENGRYTSHIDGVKKVFVSQGSREMAQHGSSGIPGAPVFEDATSEYEWLVQEKRNLESQLGMYSDAQFSTAQLKCRKENARNPNRSLTAWIELKAKMTAERRKIVERKVDIENRMKLVKTRKIQEAIERNKQGSKRADSDVIAEDGTVNFGPAVVEALGELKSIRRLLESINAKLTNE